VGWDGHSYPLYPLHHTLLCRASSMSHSKKGDGRAAEMEHFYRDHRIEFSVGLDANAWTVSIFIYYRGPQNILVTFSLNQEFKTYDDAMEAGLAAAKKWIDERASNRGPQ
jgi:hypothetical protein